MNLFFFPALAFHTILGLYRRGNRHTHIERLCERNKIPQESSKVLREEI